MDWIVTLSSNLVKQARTEYTICYRLSDECVVFETSLTCFFD